MRSTRSVCVFFIAGWVTLARALQATPDFSGQWVVDPEAAGTSSATVGPPARQVRGDMGSGWGSQITITQDSKRLVVEYTPFTRYDMQRPLRFEFALDGAEMRNMLMIGHTSQELRSRARWNGPVLEITSSYQTPHPGTGKPLTTEVVQRLSLTSPAELVVETSRSVAGAQVPTTRTVYKKSAPSR